MKKIFLPMLALTSYAYMSLYSLVDMNTYFGRWGYIKVYPDFNATDQRVRQEIPESISVNLDLDQSVVNYGSIISFVPAAQRSAAQWSNATASISGIGHVNIVLGRHDVDYYNYGADDNINSVIIDHNGFSIPVGDYTIAARTIYTRRYATNYNLCNGQSREIKEADIYMHAFVSQHLNWRNLTQSQSDAHIGTGNPNCDADFETTVLHEIGHFLGLGHIVNNASDYTVMVESTPFNTIKRDLSSEDIQAIRDLYNRGFDSNNPNTGIIPCDRWYMGNFNGVNIKCRTVTGLGDDIVSTGCQDNDNPPGDNSKDHMYCYTDDKGTTHAGYYCVFQDTRKRTPVNNFGITKPAVDNINQYIAVDHPYNYTRYWRGIIIMTENETIAKDYLSKYTMYLSTGRKLQEDSKPYANAFTAMDKTIDVFAPVVDATFRCTDNEKNPDLFMNEDRIAVLQNMNNELTRLNISDRLINEINFISKTLPRTKGMNIKQAYEYIIAAQDPNLTLK